MHNVNNQLEAEYCFNLFLLTFWFILHIGEAIADKVKKVKDIHSYNLGIVVEVL